MKPATLLHLLFFSLITIQVKAQTGQTANLQCEYLDRPIGIDTPSPRLHWQLNDDRQGAVQSAWQLIVGTDSMKVVQGKGNCWKSKKTKGANQLVTYKGKALQPFTKYYWQVNVWDKDKKKCRPSVVASFETGMMKMSNWKGKWITDSEDVNLKPAPYFRKEFSPSAKVKSARVYIAAAGLYELFINGKRVGDHRLDPMYTRFDRRTLYVTYDVTSMCNSEKIALGVLLGNGWYNHQSTAVWDFHKAP